MNGYLAVWTALFLARLALILQPSCSFRKFDEAECSEWVATSCCFPYIFMFFARNYCFSAPPGRLQVQSTLLPSFRVSEVHM